MFSTTFCWHLFLGVMSNKLFNFTIASIRERSLRLLKEQQKPAATRPNQRIVNGPRNQKLRPVPWHLFFCLPLSKPMPMFNLLRQHHNSKVSHFTLVSTGRIHPYNKTAPVEPSRVCDLPWFTVKKWFYEQLDLPWTRTPGAPAGPGSHGSCTPSPLAVSPHLELVMVVRLI